MNQPKMMLVLLVVWTLCQSPAQSQNEGIRLKSLSFQGSGTLGSTLRSSFNSVKGYGGGFEARINVTEPFSIGIEVGYAYFDVKQDDPVTLWNWAYWKTYYRSYINSDWLGDSAYFNGTKVKTSSLTNQQITSGIPIVKKDSVYQATLVPVQYINVIPVGLTLNLDLHDIVGGGRLSPFFSVGMHAYIYERNLYLDEQWSKRRMADAGPDSGMVYTFTYGFHNYATKISGEAYGASARIGADYNLSDLIGFRLSAEYNALVSWFGKSAYSNFPFKRSFTLTTGVVIRY